ncbi:MAG: fluoride efflux transporter CrcB [candidate division KSB1 bacterium]|nr:fluoride efflux transporter CrcB [candidate division KSB1 bacterium]
MQKIFFIGIGGFFGTLFRYSLSGAVQQASKSVSFPYGTLAVNLIGCLAVGFLSYLTEEFGLLNSVNRQMVFIGLLGGFTTFSTFMNETFHLTMDGRLWSSFFNVLLHVVFGFAAVWLGRIAAHAIWR